MNDIFLIPANTKKGSLILGIFRPFDLILFLSGVFITILMLMLVPLSSTTVTIVVLAPAILCSFLIMPVPYYHNVLNVIVEFYEFITSRQKYIWKGWCMKDESKKEKK